MSWVEYAVVAAVLALMVLGPLLPRTLSDPLLAALAMVGLIVFIGVVGWFVREPDLIIVFVIGGALAIYDFWKTARGNGGNGNRRR